MLKDMLQKRSRPSTEGDIAEARSAVERLLLQNLTVKMLTLKMLQNLTARMRHFFMCRKSNSQGASACESACKSLAHNLQPCNMTILVVSEHA